MFTVPFKQMPLIMLSSFSPRAYFRGDVR